MKSSWSFVDSLIASTLLIACSKSAPFLTLNPIAADKPTKPIFASLRMIDSVKELARTEVRSQSRQYQQQYDEVMREAQESMDQRLLKLREEVEKLQKQNANGQVPRAELQAKLQRFQTLQELEQRKIDVKRTKTERDRELKIREIERAA